MKTNEITSRFNQIAQDYDEQRRFFVPRFDDFYGACTEFLATIKPDVKQILELGAGTGLLTKYLLIRKLHFILCLLCLFLMIRRVELVYIK